MNKKTKQRRVNKLYEIDVSAWHPRTFIPNKDWLFTRFINEKGTPLLKLETNGDADKHIKVLFVNVYKSEYTNDILGIIEVFEHEGNQFLKSNPQKECSLRVLLNIIDDII